MTTNNDHLNNKQLITLKKLAHEASFASSVTVDKYQNKKNLLKQLANEAREKQLVENVQQQQERHRRRQQRQQKSVLKELAQKAANQATENLFENVQQRQERHRRRQQQQRGVLKELAQKAANAANNDAVLASTAAAAAKNLIPNYQQQQKNLVLQELLTTDAATTVKQSKSTAVPLTTLSHLLDHRNIQQLQQQEPIIPTPSYWLYELIKLQKWDQVHLRCMAHPQDVMYISACKNRWTPLHLLCSIGSSPSYILENMLKIWPAAARIQDKRSNDTPLHIQCRNSQRSLDKVRILLKYAEDNSSSHKNKNKNNNSDTLLPSPLQLPITSIQNRFGKTPLHVACGCVAMLPVLQALVESDPSTMCLRDCDNATPLTNLWLSYVQTIPGQLAVARILTSRRNISSYEDYDDLPKHFDRFWKKVRYLSLEAPKMLQKQKEGNDDEEQTRNLCYALLMEKSSPLHLVNIALRLEPDTTKSVVDSYGNYLLHIALKYCSELSQQGDGVSWHNKKHRKAYRDILKLILDSYPKAAGICDDNGKSPLNMFISIRTSISWDDGIQDVIHSSPKMLDYQDRETELYPFMLAALNTTNSFSLDIVYQLLLSRPELVGLGIPGRCTF